MAKFHYTILSRAHPGREEEFVAWYRDQHMADVCRMPGVISGKLFRMDFQRVYNLDDAPQWTLMTIYELEGDEPQPIIDNIRAASGSDIMPATESLNRAGMIQASGHLIQTGTGSAVPQGTVLIASRDVPLPAHLSPEAQAYLLPRPVFSAYPALDDKAGWLAYVAGSEAAMAPLFSRPGADMGAIATERDANGAKVYEITPPGMAEDDRTVVLELHGGALILCGGEICRAMGATTAARLQRRVWAVDYRMPPEHPYPAALDDALAAYRALLAERSPQEIIISGGSAGGNLAAALVLRARDEGLPLPAGVILNTPEADLTESGDSFTTNEGVDPLLHSLMPVNLLYANGHDLTDPYISPLFGDFSKGFAPTILTTGTRDLYLSNTVRLHRALRAAGIAASLHVLEAAPHTGFPGAPEGAEIDKELRLFISQQRGES